MTLRDVSAQRNLEKAEQKNFMVNLLTSSVSHELMTPLRCIVTFATEIIAHSKSPQNKHKANLINCTTKMLLSQVKLLLDKSLMDND